MTITIRCRTNLDDYQTERWPRKLACPPTVGDKIKSCSGKILHIVTVIHCCDNDGQPYLELELNKKWNL